MGIAFGLFWLIMLYGTGVCLLALWGLMVYELIKYR